jgi:hypothetical protein
MLSVEKQIERSIKSRNRGALVFPDDFNRFGSPEAIRQALVRLEDKRVIVRVAQGIYVRPVVSKAFGVLLPTAEEVAYAIAKRDKIRMIPTGSYALNALGLSNQLPMKIVFLTDGSPREIRVGNRTIKLKKTTPRNLAAKGKISQLVIQALKEIGKEKLTPTEAEKIVALLSKEKPEDLRHDMILAPVWIRKILNKALINNESD